MAGSVELTDVQTSRTSCVLRPLNPRHRTLHVTLRVGERFRFGRKAECDQSFPSDYRISGLHAALMIEGGSIVIVDSSANGTFVNRDRVPRGSWRPLVDGDCFYLVIPSIEVLQAGYTGSLTQKFVGYMFEQSDEMYDSMPATAPANESLSPPSSVAQTADAAGGPRAAMPPSDDARKRGSDAVARSSIGDDSCGTVAVEHVSFAAWWNMANVDESTEAWDRLDTLHVQPRPLQEPTGSSAAHAPRYEANYES